MQCTKPFYLTKYGMYVPCNKCLACRIARRREWSLRLAHQMQFQPAMFLTLTYNDVNIPKNGSVSKRELQLFFKRFRKIFGEDIKYFSCGEYGEQSFRPHYHAIVFGVPIKRYIDYDKNYIQFKRGNHTYFSIASKFWTNGYVVATSCSIDTIQYVCGYVLKKIKGYEKEYHDRCLTLPFQLQSQGLGKQFAFENAELIKSKLYLMYKGVKVSVPRYYRKLLGITSDDYFDVMVQQTIKKRKWLVERGLAFPFEFTFEPGSLTIYEREVLNPYRAEVLQARQRTSKKRDF